MIVPTAHCTLCWSMIGYADARLATAEAIDTATVRT